MTSPASPLFTDLYELTMVQGYLRSGLSGRMACFDLFFRENPFDGGYTLAAGLGDALRFLENLRFTREDTAYLRTLGIFGEDFLSHLESFRFAGDVYAVAEGTPVFPFEPVIRVHAPLEQGQMVESALLNVINFQSLIATKAARICAEAGKDNVLEFGLRRAQGVDGAITASRAAYIGGCSGTSNVQAGKTYGIPVRGTHAHSWVMAFESELEAFRRFTGIYPKNSVLLVDTYNTLESGMPNAIKVGTEMKRRGEKLYGVRIDSGDLAYLSMEARRMLDEAGLDETIIICSGDLDEYIIHDLRMQGCMSDSYGVGTRLVTGMGDPALSGVYKMSAVTDETGNWRMKLKISDNLKKSTFPGIKQVWRLYGKDGVITADVMELEGIENDFLLGTWGYHPFLMHQKKLYEGFAKTEPLLRKVMENGKIAIPLPPLPDIRKKAFEQISLLHPTTRRLLNPHIYKVSLGPKLMEETRRLRMGPEASE